MGDILAIAVIAVMLLSAFEFFFSTVPARGLDLDRGAGVTLTIALVTGSFDVGMGG